MAKLYSNIHAFCNTGQGVSSPRRDPTEQDAGPDLEEITCRICRGYGDILDEHTQKAKTCPTCRGTGTI